METKVGHELRMHKKEILIGFKDAFDLLVDLDRHPEKLKRLPDRGILVKTRKGKMIISAKDNGTKTLLL